MKLLITSFLYVALTTLTYADVSPDVTEGADTYNWQTCVTAKSSECINACTYSEDTDCQGDCKRVAQDKCKSLGLVPTDSELSTHTDD